MLKKTVGHEEQTKTAERKQSQQRRGFPVKEQATSDDYVRVDTILGNMHLILAPSNLKLFQSKPTNYLHNKTTAIM